MKSNYRKLGEYIRQVDVRNTEGKEDHLLGVSVQKMFMPSIANTIGTDFSKYKVVKRGQFTYIPDTSRRGDKIAIALLKDYDEGLVSNIYTVFEISDSQKLLPEYLMLWFSRPEFDRYARFKSHGSVREIMDWDELCKVELPIPSYEAQAEIVREYQTIADRIALKQKINDNLAKIIDAIFEKTIIYSNKSELVPFTDIMQIMGGGTPDTSESDYWNGKIPFFTPKDVTDSAFCIQTEKHISESGLNSCSSRLYPLFTTFITCRGTVGNTSMAGKPMAMNQSCYAVSSKSGYSPFFTYAFTKYVISTMKKKASGAVFNALVTRDFEMEKVIKPNANDVTIFDSKSTPLYKAIYYNAQEIESLVALSNHLLTRLSR